MRSRCCWRRLIALIILRRRGLYFSLLTLAFSQIAFEIAYKWTDVTGGENGVQGVPRPLFASAWSFHAFTVVTVCLGIGLLWRIAHSPFGRSLQALRDNEQRAQSLGYDIFRLKFVAFVIMGGIVGYAGGLLAFMIKGAYADNLSWQHAGDALLMAVLGGVHHFLGPLWGAIAFILLEDRLSAITESWWLIFAPIVIVFALASPEGMQGLVFRLMRRTDWTLTRKTIPARPATIEPYRTGGANLAREKPILTVAGLNKRFGSLVVATDLNLQVYPYRLHSLIGPNGAGKTTFFNMLTGILRPNAGSIVFDGHDITHLPVHRRIRLGLSRSFQILSVFPNLTVFENVRVAAQAQDKRSWGLWRDACSYDDFNARTWSLLAAVGLEDRAADACANLGHGQRRLLEIAISLATDAKLLLLDEPLAGLAEADRQVVGALIRRLADAFGAADRTRHRSRAGAVGPDYGAAPGPADRRRRPAEVGGNPDVVTAYLGAERIVRSRRRRMRTEPRDEEPAQASPGGRQAARRLCGQRGTGGSVPGGSRRRGGRAAGPQRRRQDHDAAGDYRNRAFGGRSDRVGRWGDHQRQAIRDQSERYLAGARGPSAVSQPDGTGQSAAGDAAGGCVGQRRLRAVPKLKILRGSKAESLSGGERQMLAIARALMVPAKLILLDEPFEGLAPAIVKEVMDALAQLRGRVAMVIVEHHAETVLPLVDRAYVLVNGRVAFDGTAEALEADPELQARLLGVVQKEVVEVAPRAL